MITKFNLPKDFFKEGDILTLSKNTPILRNFNPKEIIGQVLDIDDLTCTIKTNLICNFIEFDTQRIGVSMCREIINVDNGIAQVNNIIKINSISII